MSSFWDRPGAQMQYVAAASAHLGVFSLGATIGWTAPAQQYITRGYYGFNVTLMNYGWICGMLQLGCCLVAVPAGYMATRWGCKSVMLLFVVPNLGAWALLIFAPNLELLMLSRFLLGVCGGSYLVTSTMYAAEIAQLEARRALGAFLELFMVLGILFAYGAGAFGQYKILNYACAALPIALIIAFAWLPASPVYYLRRSKIEKATSALIRLRSGQLNSSGELNRMQEELAEMRESQQFKSKRKPLLLIIGIMLFKNITGRQAIISYSTYVFESLHLKSTFPLDLYSIAMGLCLLLSALLTFPVVKWVKRRSLFIFSMFSLIFNAAFVGVYFHLREDRNERIGDSLSWISLACLYCLMFFMGLGCGNLPYLVMDELLAQPFKSVYHWIVFTCSSFFGFASILSFPASVVYCTIEGAFWFFMCCAFIAVFYLFCLVPETRPVEEGAEPAEPKPVLTKMTVWKQFIAGCGAAFGAFCLGSSIGWSGPVEEPIKSGDYDNFSPSDDEWGWVSSLLNLGAACVCIPIGILIGAFGRKATMLCISFPYVIGWALIGIAQHVSMLMVGRFVLGVCGGAFSITAPMYSTEIAEIEIRGILGCFFQLLIVHGILFGFIIGAYCSVLVVNIACGVMPIVFFLWFMWMPESPVFLMQRGKTEQAQKAMKWLRGEDADIGPDLAAYQAEANKPKTNWREGLSRKASLKGLGISIALMMFQQCTGINAIIFYATSIFKSAGSPLSPELCTIVLGVVQVVATVIAILLIDRIGRKILLITSAALMFITTFLMGVYFMWLSKDVSWLPVSSICLFIVGFSVGFGPVPWLVMAELFAEDVKPIAGAISGTLNWILSFVVTKLFPLGISAWGPAPCFWIFAGFALAAVIFIIFLVPETKGKTLNEIQAVLGGE